MQPRCFFFPAVYINAAVQRFPTFVACDFSSWNYASPRRESCDGYGSTPKSQACIVQTCALRIGLVLSAVIRRKVLNKCKCPAYSYVEGTTTEMQPLCLWLVERAKPKLVFCFLAFSQAITWLNGEEVHCWVCFLPLFPGFFCNSRPSCVLWSPFEIILPCFVFFPHSLLFGGGTNQSRSKALLSQFFNLKKFQTNTHIFVAVAVVVVVVWIFLMQISSH